MRTRDLHTAGAFPGRRLRIWARMDVRNKCFISRQGGDVLVEGLPKRARIRYLLGRAIVCLALVERVYGMGCGRRRGCQGRCTEGGIAAARRRQSAETGKRDGAEQDGDGQS